MDQKESIMTHTLHDRVEGSLSCSTDRLNGLDFKLLVDAVRDYAILLIDPTGVILSWNSGAQSIQGYKAEEIIGQNISNFYTPEDLAEQRPQHELERAKLDGRYENEGWRVRKNGSRFWANVILTALFNSKGALIGYSKVTRDLSERRKAEIALKESEERFRLMVASVKDYAIIMLDPDGRIISWNAGAERIKGWKESEILGKSFENFYPPEDVKAGKTAFELKVAQETGTFEDYGWRVRKDGTRFWANVVITALFDEHHILRGYSKVTRDITERKSAEDALRKAYDELESFTYSVSHDLRAPLRSMDGFSEVLYTLYKDKLDEKGKDYLKRIRESSQRMAQLIDDLLNLSRLGRTPLNIDQVNLSEFAKKIIGDLQKENPERDVEVVIEPDIIVNGDPVLLRVVLENLLSNAWKYTSKKAHAKIEFGAQVSGGQVVYFVKDNGAGFDMEYIDKLFGAFQRLHGVKEFPGNGIGLASAKRIILRHEGSIWAKAGIDQGATFYFTLGS